MSTPKALRAVAIMEGMKGILLLAAGFGVLELLHQNVQAMAEELVRHFHLQPANHYPRIFIEAAAKITDTQFLLLAAGAAVYALVRFIEAYGLWRCRRWAEWLGALSGSVYIPIEVVELVYGIDWAKVMMLVTNLAVVGYLSYALVRTRSNPSISFSSSGPTKGI